MPEESYTLPMMVSRISNLEQALNDRQNHLFQLLNEAKKGNGKNGNTDWKMLTIMAMLMTLIAGLLGARILSVENNVMEYKHAMDREHVVLNVTMQREVDRVLDWQKVHDQNYPPAWLIDRVERIEDYVEKMRDKCISNPIK